jgi:hypothetical protein
MNRKLLLVIAAVFMCCSPTSKIEDPLIGKWYTVSMMSVEGIIPDDPTNTIVEIDSSRWTNEVDIQANTFTTNFNITYLKNTSAPYNESVTYAYSKSNDTLSLHRNNKNYFFKYKIGNDSLTMNYLFGDALGDTAYWTLTSIMKFRKK